MDQTGCHKLTENNSFLLNIIRIIAAWMVLVGHCFFAYQKTIFKNQKYFPALQNIGVVALFMLAGFLSAYSIGKKKDNSQYNFIIYLIEKICRLWSGLLPALIFIAAIDGMTISTDPEKYLYFENYNFRTFIGNIFFLQNYLSVPNGTILEELTRFNFASFGSGRPLWTLSVEWWIYIAVGFLFFVLIPSIRQKSLDFFKIILLIVVSWQSIEFLIGRETVAKANLTFFFLIGFLICLIYHSLSENQNKTYQNPFFVKMILVVTSFAMIVIVGFLVKNAYNLLFVLIFGVFFLSIVLLGETRTWAITRKMSGVTSFLASYTYSLYLVHYSVINFVAFNMSTLTKVQQFWLSFIISHFVAIVMYYLFERHSRKLSTFFIHQYRKLRA